MTYKYTKTETVGNTTITEEWVVDTFEELVKISSPQVDEESEVTPKTLQDAWDDLLQKRIEDDQKIKSGSIEDIHGCLKPKYWLGPTSLPATKVVMSELPKHQDYMFENGVIKPKPGSTKEPSMLGGSHFNIMNLEEK